MKHAESTPGGQGGEQEHGGFPADRFPFAPALSGFLKQLHTCTLLVVRGIDLDGTFCGRKCAVFSPVMLPVPTVHVRALGE